MTTVAASSISTFPVLPDDVWCGWLGQFREWVEPTTEGAIEAIFSCASVELALAIGRSVPIHYGRRTYANLYVAAVGITGVPKKSTIVSRGHDLREGAFPPETVRVSRSIGSGEGLLERFCRQEKDTGTGRVVLTPIPEQRVLLDEPELTNLLKKARRPGTANITEILMGLYDGDDWSPNTRSRPIKVEKPFFSLITTSTPESLESALRDEDIESGLLPRFATFWCTPREPIPYPPLPDENQRQGLVNRLREIAQHAAELGLAQPALALSGKARTEWDTAYHDFTLEMRKAPKAVGAIMARVPTMVMKWALLYALQAGHASIEVDDLARGILVGTYLNETASLVPGHVSKTIVARIEHKIVESLRRVQGKWLLASDVHRLVSGRIKADELRRSLHSLVQLGVIEEASSQSGTSMVYRVPWPHHDQG